MGKFYKKAKKITKSWENHIFAKHLIHIGFRLKIKTWVKVQIPYYDNDLTIS